MQKEKNKTIVNTNNQNVQFMPPWKISLMEHRY